MSMCIRRLIGGSVIHTGRRLYLPLLAGILLSCDPGLSEDQTAWHDARAEVTIDSPLVREIKEGFWPTPKTDNSCSPPSKGPRLGSRDWRKEFQGHTRATYKFITATKRAEATVVEWGWKMELDPEIKGLTR